MLESSFGGALESSFPEEGFGVDPSILSQMADRQEAPPGTPRQGGSFDEEGGLDDGVEMGPAVTMSM